MATFRDLSSFAPRTLFSKRYRFRAQRENMSSQSTKTTSTLKANSPLPHSSEEKDHFRKDAMQSQREDRMANWVVRNRKRLSYESKFMESARRLDENRTASALYPHALASRLAKKGVVEMDGSGVDVEVVGLENEVEDVDGLEVERSSFV